MRNPITCDLQRLAVVIPAAGQGQRMGQLKQLLPWQYTTVLGQTLLNCRAAGLHQLFVITGNATVAVAAEARRYGATPVYNAAYQTGEILSSIQAGIQALPTTVAAVLVLLADQPMIGPALLQQVVVYWRGRTNALCVPTYQQKWGHPVLIGRDYFAELRALPQTARARTLLKTHPQALQTVAMQSPTILADLDTPADYQRWHPTNPNA